MKNLVKRFRSIEYGRHVPAVLFLVALAAYGVFLPQMGFYWDDQPISWIRYQLGREALTRYFSEVRPVWAMLYQATTTILPQQPLYWQVFAILLRWLTAVAFWGILTQLFPNRRILAFTVSAAMLVYPGFNQQWVSFVYVHFYLVFLCLLSSWYLTLRKRTVPALVFSALNLWMLEYFFFLELARPFLIWMTLRGETMPLRERFLRVTKAWVPYLVVFAAAIVYRMLVFNHPGFGYSLTDELRRAPVETLLSLLQQALSSLWTVTFTAWAQGFRLPDPAVDGPRITVLFALLVLAVGALLFWSVFVRQDREDPAKTGDAGWLFFLGVPLLLLGGIPFWVANLQVSLEFPASRATLSFMLGACLVLMGLLDLFSPRVKFSLLILLISLAVGRQFLLANEFKRDWETQKNLFWQMTWRAPGLKPDTLVLMNEALNYSADNSISAALNWIYAPTFRGEEIPFALFYPTNRLGGSLPDLKPGLPVRFPYEAGTFHGNTSDAVAFYFKPPACLRLLDPVLDVDSRFLSDESLMREASALSNADRILADPEAVLPAIYGPEPAHGWCYYFEKADLAAQFGDWETVTRLGDEAFQIDDYPNNPLERFPFIEGYAHAGQWGRAVELSQVSYRVSKEFVGPSLCRLWQRIETETSGGVEGDASSGEAISRRSEALSKVTSMFACSSE